MTAEVSVSKGATHLFTNLIANTNKEAWNKFDMAHGNTTIHSLPCRTINAVAKRGYLHNTKDYFDLHLYPANDEQDWRAPSSVPHTNMLYI